LFIEFKVFFKHRLYTVRPNFKRPNVKRPNLEMAEFHLTEK
jgi:hypothetical protein